MYDSDLNAHGLGIRIAAITRLFATVSIAVRENMTKGHAICLWRNQFHAAGTAFACNSAVYAIATASVTIDFLVAAHLGEQLTAAARELWQRGRTGFYGVITTNSSDATVAVLRAARINRIPTALTLRISHDRCLHL